MGIKKIQDIINHVKVADILESDDFLIKIYINIRNERSKKYKGVINYRSELI